MSATSVKMVVFDLDGTLVDSMRDFSAIAQAVMAKHFGISPDQALHDYRNTSGLPFVQQVGLLFPDHPKQAEAVEEFESRKMADYHNAPLFPEVQNVLETLRRQGFKLAISSNNHEHNVTRKIRISNLKVDDVLGYRQGFGKGQDHFHFLETRHALDSTQMFFIGDSLHDARMANQNGVRFGARLGTFSREDFARLGLPFHAIENLTELFSLL